MTPERKAGSAFDDLLRIGKEREQGGRTPPTQPQQPAAPQRQGGGMDDLMRLGQEREQAQGDQPSLLRRAGEIATVPFRAARDAIQGQQDPRFTEVPALDMSALPLDVQAGINRGRAVTFDDDAYGDIVRKQLGNRYIGTERDANDYQLITYIDNEGQERTEYLNRPGLDWDDVDRTAASALPFMVGAGAANLGLRGVGATGVVPRFLAHGAAAGGASVGSDMVAGGLGSEQGVDAPRAAVAAGAGGVFEGLSGPIVRAWQSVFRKSPVGPDGRLTGEAREAAIKAGLDPDDMSERLIQDFARDTQRAADAGEVAGKFRSGEFNIPTTYGQRSKRPDALGQEEEMRRGLMGRDAQSVMQDFDRRQTQAVEGAVYDAVGNRVAPQASGRDPRAVGEGIQQGMRSSQRAMSDQEDVVWSRVTEMFPEDGAFSSLPAALKSSIDKRSVVLDPELLPATDRMLRDLQRYARGKTPKSNYALLPQDVKNLDVDTMRRRLLARTRNAKDPADARAASAVYDGFNEWIDTAAEQALLSGSPDAAAALRSARAFTREMKQLFRPADRTGRPTAGARKIERVMERADTPEGVVNALFGSSAPTRPPQEGTREALRHMRDILARNGQEQAWDDVRMAYWLRIAQDNKGRVLSPRRLKNNIDGALNSQGSIVDELFTGVEKSYMQRMSRALDDLVYTPPNPSGTSYELMRMQRAAGGEPIAKTILQTQAKRELFSKGNVLMSRIYSSLARRIPNVAGVKDAAGTSVARQATSQDIRPRAPGAWFIAPLAATGAVESMD